MVSCDICGKPAVGRAIVEGAEVAVCPSCAQHGRMLTTPQQRQVNVPQSQREVSLVQGFGHVISRARTAQGLSKVELAAKLNIAERDIEHFESEKIKPMEKDVRKLEAFLKVKLVEADAAAVGVGSPTQRPTVKKGSLGPITLADIVEIKHAKKK